MSDDEGGQIDPCDAAFFVRDDYYDVLARLRAEDPVHECAPGFWAVSRYEDIRNLSRDPGHFCSGRGALVNDPLRTTGAAMGGRSILHMDPPQHAAFRGLVNRRFTPRAMAGLSDFIRVSASRLLDAVEPRDEIDFVAQLAAPFPLAVIAELLGIDESDREDFRGWSDTAIESPDLPPDETMAALGQLSGFIVEHIRSKRERPGEDLVSLLVGSEVGGCPLSRGKVHVPPHAARGGKRDHRTLLSGTAVVLLRLRRLRDLDRSDVHAVAALAARARRDLCHRARARWRGLGRSWYEGGRLEHKQTSFLDFVDVARGLVDAGFTDSAHLAAMGGSAGGLLMPSITSRRTRSVPSSPRCRSSTC